MVRIRLQKEGVKRTLDLEESEAADLTIVLTRLMLAPSHTKGIDNAKTAWKDTFIYVTRD